jgi:acetyl esterase/lipase
VLTAPGEPDLQALAPVGQQQVLRLDVALREPDLTSGLVAHVQGRGVWGVVWALRAVHHRRRYPIHREAYGDRRDQFGELRLPAGDGPFPVATVLHGGFWRSCWQLDLMDAVSVDLAERGLATWNVEYRRPDRHGWRATVQDVRRSIEHLHALAARWPLDLDRVAVVGHSAGGSMAVQLAGDAVAARVPHLRLVVQLAGLVDLVGTHRRDIGNGAVVTALGGTPEERPQVYAQASPLERLPVGVPQAVVVGRAESPDLREMSRRYVRAARAAGDDVTFVEDDGDHFTVIDPASGIWQRTAARLTEALG